MSESKSYHDVEVEFNGNRFSLFGAYTYRLTCTCAGGWELWGLLDGKEKLLAGEFDEAPLRIYVDGVLICGKPDEH